MNGLKQAIPTISTSYGLNENQLMIHTCSRYTFRNEALNKSPFSASSSRLSLSHSITTSLGIELVTVISCLHLFPYAWTVNRIKVKSKFANAACAATASANMSHQKS